MRKLIVAVIAAVVLFLGATLAAGDLGGEVVVLTTQTSGGAEKDTKLWIVEDNRQLWIRAGTDADWLRRLKAQPNVKLTRAGETGRYRAVVVTKQRDRINRLMAERYGWADALIGVVRDVSLSTPVRLDPVR